MHLSDPTDPPKRIPTRTEQRALDWGLVLASQGISAHIQNDSELGWGLLVPSAEYDTAVKAIAQYRRENAHWPWQQSVPQSAEIFDWVSVFWVLLTWLFFQFQMTMPSWQAAGVVDSVAVKRGEWWRLFTAQFLHADALHLASNAVFGFLLLGLAMGRFGTGIGLLTAYLGGAAGNWFSLLVHPEPHHALGASGAVMAALGMIVAPSGTAHRHPRGWKFAIGGVAVGIMLFTLLGLHPGSDIAAHLGGFLAGLAFGTILSRAPKLTRQPAINLIAGLLFTLMIIWSWLLALKSTR